MSVEVAADARIARRPNTTLIPWTERGNALRLFRHCVFSRPDIYFFPRCGPLDRAFFDFRKHVHSRTALISYIVTTMNATARAGLMGRSVREADVVCANSDFVAKTVQRGFDREAIVMHDGADNRFYFAWEGQQRSESLTVLYAGSFRPLKRPELVIEQARRWPQVEFRLAGKGEMEARCRELCEQYGCGNVRFLGHLSPPRLGYEMRQADVFFFPSVLEGHPQVLIQAASCGLPIVAMNAYRPDCVVDGATGFLATGDEELSRRLELLLGSPEMRMKMSGAAVAHSRKFNWDRIAERWANLFIQVATGYPRISNLQNAANEALRA